MSWACVCRYGGVGDNLIVSAVLPALKKKYGNVEVITQRPQHVLFENNPYIDKLSVHNAGEIPGESPEAWKRWHDIRGREYAFFVNLSHSVEMLHAFLPAQTQASWPIEWRRKYAGGSYVASAASICGVDFADCAPGFFPTEEENQQAIETKAKVGGPCIGWVLSGTRIDKIYPASTLAIARLIQELGAKVILFGGPGRDFRMALQIQEYVKLHNGSLDGLHGACDEKPDNQTWTIRRIITQLQHCDLVISPDTGPAWGVAMCDVPKIMMVSHASPENITTGWKNTTTLHADPEEIKCWSCHRLHDSLDTCTADETGKAAACISNISVQAILDAAKIWLFRKDICFDFARPFSSVQLKKRMAGESVTDGGNFTQGSSREGLAPVLYGKTMPQGASLPKARAGPDMRKMSKRLAERAPRIAEETEGSFGAPNGKANQDAQI